MSFVCGVNVRYSSTKANHQSAAAVGKFPCIRIRGFFVIIGTFDPSRNTGEEIQISYVGSLEVFLLYATGAKLSIFRRQIM